MKYRKYGFVSNRRKYYMLWLRFATSFTDIMYQKPNISQVPIENT